MGTWVWHCILNCSVYPVKVTDFHWTKSPQGFQKTETPTNSKGFSVINWQECVVNKNSSTCIVQMCTPKIAIVFLDEWAYSLSWFILVIHFCRMCATVIVIDDSEENCWPLQNVTNPLVTNICCLCKEAAYIWRCRETLWVWFMKSRKESLASCLGMQTCAEHLSRNVPASP